MKNIVDDKQFGTKEAVKIISPLNASWKLLASELFKLFKLILLDHALMLPVKDALNIKT